MPSSGRYHRVRFHGGVAAFSGGTDGDPDGGAAFVRYELGYGNLHCHPLLAGDCMAGIRFYLFLGGSGDAGGFVFV